MSQIGYGSAPVPPFSLETIPSGLPGTELENVLAERVALMDEPFCPSLSRELIREVRALDAARFRRVYGQNERASSFTAGSTAQDSSRPATRYS